jgi:hypothetical protein
MSVLQYIQQTTNTFFTGTASTTLSVPINNLPTVGNTLVGIVKKSSAGVTLSSITDPRGNVWSFDVPGVVVGNGAGTYIVSCPVVTAYQAGDTLTLTYSTAINDTGMICAEFSGIRLPVSVAYAFHSLGTNGTTDTIALGGSTHSPFDLIISGISTGSGGSQTFTPPSSPWVQLQTAGGSSAQQMNMAFLLAHATGTFSHTWSWTTSSGDLLAIATYASQAQGSLLSIL